MGKSILFYLLIAVGATAQGERGENPFIRTIYELGGKPKQVMESWVHRAYADGDFREGIQNVSSPVHTVKRYGREFQAPDYQRGLAHLKKASDAGYIAASFVGAMVLMRSYMLNGEMPETYLRVFAPALAAQELCIGYHLYGDMYARGIGVGKDPARAAAIYKEGKESCLRDPVPEWLKTQIITKYQNARIQSGILSQGQ